MREKDTGEEELRFRRRHDEVNSGGFVRLFGFVRLVVLVVGHESHPPKRSNPDAKSRTPTIPERGEKIVAAERCNWSCQNVRHILLYIVFY